MPSWIDQGGPIMYALLVCSLLAVTITIERLERKFGVGVESEPVKVPYRETISRPAEAEGKYKKQTGGHGQFGVAQIRLAPMGRGDGFEFVDERCVAAHRAGGGHRILRGGGDLPPK